MSEFKKKLKKLLKDKNINNDIIFNRSLLKIHKKIKRENSTKLLNTNLNIKNIYKNNSERNSLNKYSFEKLKRSKSTNNLINIMRSFSIHDIHSNNYKNKKNYNYNNIYNNKRLNYELNNKINYVGSILNYQFINYMNNIKRKKSSINSNSVINSYFCNRKESICPNNGNKTSIYNKNYINNSFRTGNKFNNNKNKKYLINNSKKVITYII